MGRLVAPASREPRWLLVINWELVSGRVQRPQFTLLRPQSAQGLAAGHIDQRTSGEKRMKATSPIRPMRQPPKSLGTAAEVSRFQANNSAPAAVSVTNVPESCSLSQPRSMARLKPALYSAGLARSTYRKGPGSCASGADPFR